MLLSTAGKVLNRIFQNRLKVEVDKRLRDEQAGFRKDWSCTDQIAILKIVLEQSLEWNFPVYATFVDYEKAFDSVDREVCGSCYATMASQRKTSPLYRRSTRSASVESSTTELFENCLRCSLECTRVA